MNDTAKVPATMYDTDKAEILGRLREVERRIAVIRRELATAAPEVAVVTSAAFWAGQELNRVIAVARRA